MGTNVETNKIQLTIDRKHARQSAEKQCFPRTGQVIIGIRIFDYNLRASPNNILHKKIMRIEVAIDASIDVIKNNS